MTYSLIFFILTMLTCFATFAWSSLGLFDERREGYEFIYLLLKITSVSFWVYSIFLAFTIETTLVTLVVIGSCFNLLSLGIFYWSSKTIKDFHFTAIYGKDIPDQLITNGPYRFVRNPFYSCYLLCYLSTAVALQSVALVLTFVLLLFLYLFAIRLEENKFVWSDNLVEYHKYRRKTGTLIPKLPRLSKTEKDSSEQSKTLSS